LKSGALHLPGRHRCLQVTGTRPRACPRVPGRRRGEGREDTRGAPGDSLVDLWVDGDEACRVAVTGDRTFDPRRRRALGLGEPSRTGLIRCPTGREVAQPEREAPRERLIGGTDTCRCKGSRRGEGHRDEDGDALHANSVRPASQFVKNSECADQFLKPSGEAPRSQSPLEQSCSRTACRAE
jgi:hypothetical protein